MRSILPWLLPAGLLITVAIFALFPPLSSTAVALAWAWIGLPAGLRFVRSRLRTRDAADDHGSSAFYERYSRTKLSP